ncbi:pyridoxamine 5'-phosphate oxidase family protein [Nitrosopumilus sp.]|jgi:nitroimidazol reductase NimA-like FMN-containing flavoprotein (pyridoxamine 5'-phosphate oxidase superfamily)|nr:pyridoxamine 5'-phosphate oxidase family protein [Nitrosopumilus sp.]MDC0522679.1 pyridoxamine 5'-phosphate oxidase family protein [Nitrosopumilus sp.]MDC3292229.1 pyridoxamine 5'-phosphate oxidase family protein [Nitrosopumilus sp.]MDO7722493.1 pyridoxamine 5'-phosphate oxidase family protein [Nitrosopumilus sp.]MDO7727457.1 pyridoxamine 5'-phosphate oxidase family protein [Nitrosopumilus sp.]|tara:strand:- start:497 stop:898 length:402 start_codon:yes stop_codon:yes gene_type:complete
MNKRDEFLKIQKILRLSTIDKSNFPHITPVWYIFNDEKIYIGTNTKNQKIKNIEKNNHVSFCVDVGVNSPDIYGVMGQGIANIILEIPKVRTIAEKILLKYFKTLENKSAKELLEDTDCVIEIIPQKYSEWNY